MKTRLCLLSVLLLQSLSICFAQATKDELAIKAVLEGHSQACLEADVAKAISYYARSPYVATAFNELGYDRGYEATTALYKKEFANSQKSPDKLTTNTYRYRIVNNTAFVTYIETYTKPDGSVSKVHKANYLEKEHGHWKIIGNFWIPEKTPWCIEDVKKVADGGSNLAKILQGDGTGANYSSNSTATINQDYSYNTAKLKQYGYTNSASLTQMIGDNNVIKGVTGKYALQQGNNNTLSVTHNSGPQSTAGGYVLNTASVSQIGDGNTATIMQTSRNN